MSPDDIHRTTKRVTTVTEQIRVMQAKRRQLHDEYNEVDAVVTSLFQLRNGLVEKLAKEVK